MKSGQSLCMGVLLGLAAMAAGGAHAGGNVNWSVSVNVPLDHGVRLGTVISGGGYGHYGPPAVMVGPPVYVAPVPVYGYPAPIVYVQRPAPVWVQRGPHGHPGWRHAQRHHHGRWHRHSH